MATVPAQQQPLQRGIVKQVLSGDSLIIRGQPRGGPPPEKTINLAWVSAPKVSKRLPPTTENPKGQQTPEEPYGFEAREYLRKKLIGKEISFRLEYTVPFGAQKRECGVVFVGEENLIETLVKEGYVDVLKRKQNAEHPDVISLTELETAAVQAGVGKHAESVTKRQVQYEVEDGQSLIGKTFSGIVEHVINGSTIRVALELAPNSYQMITIMLSGIRSPTAGEPFGDEARFFTETRLLQKDIQVRIEQITGTINPAFHGSVTLGSNNIAEALVKEGMAKCMDRTLLSALGPEKLRAGEILAKSKKLRIWKDYTVRVVSESDTFEAKVMEVVNADCLVVQKVATGEEKKIFLASVRGPPRPENEKVTRALYDVPFMFEAREFLRRRLIHKKVKVHIDYVQPAKDQFAEKTCCTVTASDGLNVAEALISRGLATTVRYRPDDESRSSAYDALQMAEQKAREQKKGIHGKPDAGLIRIIELNDAAKAKQFSGFLLRGSNNSKREALVEYVLSASKVKLYIPKENCLLSLIFVGINTPRGNEPFVSEGQSFVKSLIHQKEIQVSIEAVDKVGNFLGTIYFDGNRNVTLELIRNGYASIRDERGSEYKEAEDAAKGAKLGIWEKYIEVVAPKEEENGDDDDEEKPAVAATNGTEPKPVRDDRKKVIVTDVSPDCKTISTQDVAGGAALEELLEELRDELNNNPPLPGAFHPVKGDVCAAKFSADQQWYRARIDKTLPSGAQVTFIDYGNKESVTNADLAPLPSSKFNTATFPAVAKDYGLAYASLPEDADLVADARDTFLQEIGERTVLLKVEYKEAGGLDHVTLWDAESKDKDIVLGLVTEGYFLVNMKDRRRERRLQQTITNYKQAMDEAKKNRLNLWRYGDFTEDDAKEFGFK
ncbi:Nuclease domain-containing protein [Halotydeus destructor]|nr:Nuclease domain-containing protein [Halotydeus destructor]